MAATDAPRETGSAGYAWTGRFDHRDRKYTEMIRQPSPTGLSVARSRAITLVLLAGPLFLLVALSLLMADSAGTSAGAPDLGFRAIG